MTSRTEETFFEKIDVMINKLMQYFSIKENNKISQVQILERLQEKLINKKFKKLYPTLFIIKEVYILLHIMCINQ